MSIRVFKDWEANPAVDRHSYKLSNRQAIELVDGGTHFKVKCWDGVTAIQAYPPPQERMGRYNLIPFGRVLNKMLKPPTINYPIPACGAKNPPTVSMLQMYSASPEGAW